MASLALAFDLLARDRASKTFDKVGDSAERAGKRGSAFGSALKGGLGLAAGALAGVGLVDFFKSANDEARESQKVGALTTQVIKSTGGAAKVTAGQVGDLATAISNKTGIDDEAIQSASNLLLTFTNVRNEVGKGNDIFNQATQAATDMGAALGKDPKAGAIQLGKALNDPIKGVTALTKVGVSFTAQQKASIKSMVDSGNTLGAQKVILGELNKEFGGAAAASATAGEKFSTTFGNFKEAIGTALLPILDKLLGSLTNIFGSLTTKIGPAFTSAGTAIGKIRDAFTYLFTDGADGAQSFAEIVDNIFGNSGRLVGPLRAVSQIVKDVILGFRAMFLAFKDGDVTSNGIVGAFERIGVFARTQVVPAVMGIVNAVRGFVAVALPIVQQFVAGMMVRIGPLMPQVRAIFTAIGQIVVGVMGLIRAVIQRVTAVIGFIWSHWGNQIMNFTGAIFRAILTVIRGALGIIQGVIKVVTSLIKGDWSGAWVGIKQIVSGALTVIKGLVSGSMTVLRAVMSAAWAGIKAGASAAWSGIKSAVSAGASGVVSFVGSLPGRFMSALGSLGSLLYNAGSELIQGLINGIMSRIEAVGRAAASIASKIKGFFPGSPVKEGPLTSWNNGGAGKRLAHTLAYGLDSGRPLVAAASGRLAGAVGAPGGSLAVAGATAGGAGGGAATFHLYDRDGMLMGTMRGVAAGEVSAAATTAKWSR